MTDQEIQPFLGKPVRVSLRASDGDGHSHRHYLVSSDPVREGDRPVSEMIHGGDQITNIEDASDDPAATE